MAILLVGYYGYGNAGDEFLLQQATQYLADSIPREPIVHFSKLKTILYVYKASCVVFGGGGLLQNKSSTRSLLYYLGIISLARCFNVPVVLLSQGIGPIKGRLLKRLTVYVLSFCSFVSVRDSVSYNVAKQGAPCVVQSIDLAFYKQRIGGHSEFNVCDPNGAVFINVRAGREWDSYSSVLSPLFKSLSMGISVIAQPGVDVSLFTTEIHLLDLFSTYQRYNGPSVRAMISMRYHGCVWAILNGVPCLALAYDEKVVQLALRFNLPYLDLRTTYDIGYLKHYIDSFLKDPEDSLKKRQILQPYDAIDAHFNELQTLLLRKAFGV